MSDIQIEFAVQMHGDKCADSVRKALNGVGKVDIDVKQGRVIVQTQRPWSDIHDILESTGRRSVLTGFGGQSAVAMVNTTGESSFIRKTPTRIQGVVRFSAIKQALPGVVVDGVIDGLAPGLHGLHVHESGDISQGCESLGGHYNPRNSPHGGPEDEGSQRHAGDLGNIRADENGRASFRFIDPLLNVGEIIGRAVVVTKQEDDLGHGQTDLSRTDGNSGKRIACGIIARSAGILQNFKRICACDGVTLWDERDKPLAGRNRSQKE